MSRWNFALISVILTAGLIAACLIWRRSLANQASHLVATVYSGGSLGESTFSSNAISSWHEALREFGRPEAWKIQNVLVQGSGTPVNVQVKTRRRKMTYIEEWHLHNGKVYSFGLRSESR